LNETRLRSAFAFDSDELIGRSRRVAVGAIDVPTFDPIDTLVHVAVHACMAGGNRLLWCQDLAQIVANQRVDWAFVTERARAIGAGPPVAVMLMVASRTLAFDVPRDVLRKLSPGPVWRHVARIAAALAPVERWSGHGSIARDVARTTRRDDRASVNALTRRYASVVRRGRRATPHLTNRDARDPESVLFPAGDARDRDAYFAAVERDAIDDRL
jgi:putative nucleotidyltransferase-like protein